VLWGKKKVGWGGGERQAEENNSQKH